jgi:cell shape-determining protein MreC
MKKRFSRRHNSFVGAYPWAGPALLGLVALVIVVAAFRFLLPGTLIAVSKPFWSAGSGLSAGVGNAGSFFADKTKLMNERDALLRENAALLAANATSAARAADLALLLGDRADAGTGVLAGVLARPPVSPYDVLVIDQGSDEGIHAGDRVQGPGGMPIGTIESVTKFSARVLLYSTPAKETESWIGEARIPVTVIGEGAGSLSAEVARDAGISVGDLVYMMGPGALAVGSVVMVGNDPSSPRSRVDIRPLQNPFSITWVTVTP